MKDIERIPNLLIILPLRLYLYLLSYALVDCQLNTIALVFPSLTGDFKQFIRPTVGLA